jgi:hypothetical protein
MKAISGKLAVTTILLMVVAIPAIGKEVFLSDLDAISSHVHGPLRKDVGYQGKTIIMDGQEYKKGIVIHVENDGYSEAIYDASGYKTFIADIGIDENNGGEANQASVIFFVYIDDNGKWKEKYHSETVRWETPTIHLEIDISGTSKLRLYCTDAGDGINSDHATWANARMDTKSLLPVKPLGKLSTAWGQIKSHQ